MRTEQQWMEGCKPARRATIEAKTFSSGNVLEQTAVAGDTWQYFGVKMLNEGGQEPLTQTTHCCVQFGTSKNIPQKAENNLSQKTKGHHITVSNILWNSLLPKWLRV